MNLKENNIVTQALEAFQQETRIPVQLEQVEGVFVNERFGEKVRLGENEYWIEVKKNLTPANAGHIAQHFGNDPNKLLLATTYVNPHLAKTLRDLGIQFIDTVGNVFIDVPPTLIYLRGNKPPIAEPIRKGKGFGRATVQVVFALLCNKELCNATYRDIAQQADVALGTVVGIINDLLTQGFLVELHNKKRHLIRKTELLEKWVDAYAEKLRPKTLIGVYRTQQQDLLRTFDVNEYHAWWGGEAAAHRLTRYLKPEVMTIYMEKIANELLLHLKLRQDKNGDVELRKRFWKFEAPDAIVDTVPPLLIYADLMATGDARNIETAKLIYNDYLKGYFGQN